MNPKPGKKRLDVLMVERGLAASSQRAQAMILAGEVLVDGVNVVKMNKADLMQFRRHQTAMVFQKFALLPHRTVLDNTVYGLEVQGVSRKRQVESAMLWIERVGLSGFQNRYPNQLSGGMQQRVGLARRVDQRCSNPPHG